MTERFKLRWPVDGRTITQRFGENPHVYAKFRQAGHEGLDFSTPEGGDVYACAGGVVDAVQPNNGNAYGLYVRLRHRVGDREYQTVYAHLSKAFVVSGQSVSAGQRVALSGNTGHSFGPHLHLTLKLIGAKTPGYPDGVIDPWPYLREEVTPAPPASGLTIYTIEPVRLRAAATTSSAQLAWLEGGEPLTVLGDAAAARSRVGQYGAWIRVRRADGLDGFVAAWYVQLEAPAPLPVSFEPPAPQPPEELVVYATEALNVRRGPSVGTSRAAIVLPHDPLTVIGDAEEKRWQIGDRGQWLDVRLPDGARGYVAAWYVQLSPGPAPADMLVVYPTEDMNIREYPTVRARQVGQATRSMPLVVHDDPLRARALVGRFDEWLYVEMPEGQRGWVAAWYVSAVPT
jgi:uncharacterized protein YgiM (DUF1202 family)